jgi:hypothetical protein
MGILFSWFTRAEVAAEAHPSLATPLNLMNDEPFRLLDLPLEVVDCIISCAGREALKPLRSSCKALETITFDRFATEYFEHIYCWAARTDHFIGLKNVLDHSTRISSRIRKLTLAARILDCPQSRAIKAAPDHLDSGETASTDLPDIYCVGLLTVLRALQGVPRLPQEVSVDVDLAWMSQADFEYGHYHHPQKAILAAIAMSHLKVRLFSADKWTFYECDDLLK